jgi:hypothetical protein
VGLRLACPAEDLIASGRHYGARNGDAVVGIEVDGTLAGFDGRIVLGVLAAALDVSVNPPITLVRDAARTASH